MEIEYLGGDKKGQKRRSDISKDASDPVSTGKRF